jgi:uncharacterized membrane protein YjfL (UPF0719 family)
MPEQSLMDQLWLMIPTTLYFLLGIILFGFSVWLMEKVTPFSMRKEIEEDENVALGIIIAGALIALAIVLAAAIMPGG